MSHCHNYDISNTCVCKTFGLIEYPLCAISNLLKHFINLLSILFTLLLKIGATYESFHVLGASLGAHVAGYVGYFCQGKIGRITGVS